LFDCTIEREDRKVKQDRVKYCGGERRIKITTYKKG
jgi:hypothetical protein